MRLKESHSLRNNRAELIGAGGTVLAVIKPLGNEQYKCMFSPIGLAVLRRHALQKTSGVNPRIRIRARLRSSVVNTKRVKLRTPLRPETLTGFIVAGDPRQAARQAIRGQKQDG